MSKNENCPKQDPTTFSSIKEYLQTLSRTQRRMVDNVTQVATNVVLLNVCVCGGGAVDGPSNTSSSTRSELAGFTSSLPFIPSLGRY